MTRRLSGSLVLLLLLVAGVAEAQVKIGAEAKVKASGEGEAGATAAASAEAPASEAAAAAATPAIEPAAEAEPAVEPEAPAEPEGPAAPPWRLGLVAKKRGYAARPLNAQQGVVRLDFGPSDFAYMDSGELNSGRGLQLNAGPGGGNAWTAGMGISFGLLDCLELGALVAPLQVVPELDYGDAELYGRTRITKWLSAQLTFQLPSQTDFGVGIGLPMRFPIGDAMRLDTGVEAELVFADDFRGNLDVPVALDMNLGERGFAGVRTGVFLSDFADLAVSAGFQAGVLLDDMADITFSCSWPRLVWTGAGDSINGDVINITLGLTLYIDARDDGTPEEKARARAKAAPRVEPAGDSAEG